MLKIIISGCNGRMGQAVSAICKSDENIEVVAAIDPFSTAEYADYSTHPNILAFRGDADVIIDFSNPNTLPHLLQYCVKTKTPAVLCTTGYTPEDEILIAETSKIVPLFKSGNMSLGINLLADLIKKAVQALGTDFDIEIVERHHKEKIDAPSGTAFMLADAARDALPYDPAYVFERQSTRSARSPREIGISAVRGGTIVGEHEVIFAGLDEIIELKHTATSRNVFANGAVAAAKFMATARTPGLYDMNDVIAQ